MPRIGRGDADTEDTATAGVQTPDVSEPPVYTNLVYEALDVYERYDNNAAVFGGTMSRERHHADKSRDKSRLRPRLTVLVR